MAVNCSLDPFAKLGGIAGEIVIDTRVAFVTVARKVLDRPSTETVTVLTPGATPVITPLLLTVTAAGFDEL